MKRIYRSYKEPIRVRLTWDERWESDDEGLIVCWESGREMREERPELAKCAENGELPILTWKGGVEKKLKSKEKFGTFRYLAQWQGLRGEDLDLDLSQEPELTCTKTSMKVTYTRDAKKYST